MSANKTTGNIGTGIKAKGFEGMITLEDVKNNFTKYNFLIRLHDMTIDTTRFFGCAYSNNNLLSGSNLVPTQVKTMLDNGNIQGLVLYNLQPGINQEANEENVRECIIIPEIDKSQAILNYRIQVKSKRNFLLNQKESTHLPK